MNYYQEITLLPDSEIALGFIWQNVFQQVHIALVDNKVAPNQSNIAVSFPQYGQNQFLLGSKLRLFAQEKAHLEALNIADWLNRLVDYVHIKRIQVVPDNVSYVCFSRKHVKSFARIEKDMQQKARRWATKSGKTLPEALIDLEKTKPDGHCRLPFIYLHSQETKRCSPDANCKFPLFIQMETMNSPQQGRFSCYGLSMKDNVKGVQATVPQF